MTRAWLDDAACVSIGPDLFFSEEPGDRPAAQRFCRTRCPVVSECLADAMDFEVGLPRNRRFGIQGAMTPTQRDQLARGTRKSGPVGAAPRVLPLLRLGMPTADIAAVVGVTPDSVRRIRREHMVGVPR